MHDADTVDIIEEAFCQRQIMNGIEDISLANPVIADNAVDLRRELQASLAVVFEIGQGEFFEIHFRVLDSGCEV